MKIQLAAAALAALVLSACGGGGEGTPPDSGSSAYPLSVSKLGSGTVTSAPAGIDCGTNCQSDFAAGTTVTLTATPAASQTFAGWGGICSGTEPTCSTAMSEARNAIATFSPVAPTSYRFNVSLAGTGRVSSQPGGIDCGATCQADFPADTSVTLTATAGANHSFTGWGGACAGTTPSCTLAATTVRNVTAAFTPIGGGPVALSVAVSGSGVVTSQPAGINCGSTCSALYPVNATITLAAVPAAGQIFAGWAGACAGAAPSCSVIMANAQAASAAFVPAPVSGWQNPDLVSSPGLGAMGNARVGIDANGNVMAVWRQDRTAEFDGYRVWSRRHVSGTGWGTITLLDSIPIGSGTIGELSLTVNPATGGAVAGWTKSLNASPPTVDIVARAFNPASGAWGSAAVIDTAEGETSGSASFSPTLARLDLASDPSDNVVAVWAQSPALTGRGRFSVWANRFSPAGGWARAAEIETNNTLGVQDGDPKVAMMGNGDAVVVWVNSDGARSSIWSNKYSAGAGWGTAAVLVNYQGTNRVVAAPAIASDQAGTAMVTWGQLDFSSADGAYLSNTWSKRYSGGSWSNTNLPVGPNVVSNTMPNPRVKFGAPGIATVMWVDPVGTRNINVNQSRADGSWDIAQIANPAEARSLNEFPDYGVDDQGNVTLVWVRVPSTSTERGRVFGARLTAGVGWGVPEPLESYDTFTTFVAQGPRIAMNARGNATIVWAHVLSSSVGSQILARPFASGR